MASILNRGGLAFALIVLIFTSSSFDTTKVADARSVARQLANDCDDNPIQSEIPGCPGSGGPSKPRPPSRPSRPSKKEKGVRPPGSSRCPRGCCGGLTKMGDCICC